MVKKLCEVHDEALREIEERESSHFEALRCKATAETTTSSAPTSEKTSALFPDSLPDEEARLEAPALTFEDARRAASFVEGTHVHIVVSRV